ncbi:MAG TPA: ATP-binding protein [Burkholderiales bacterium]
MDAPRPVDYLEGLIEGFVAYGADWRMTYMNASAERLLGRRRAEVLGKTWHEAFPHAVGNEVDLMYQRVKRERAAERMELYYEHYGRWMEISASPLADGGVGVYFQDISKRKRAESALQRANEELRESGRRKDEFLATLAHELRNPLAPISNSLEILNLQTPTDPALQAARDIIGRQLRHLVRLIDDLLDVSRITSGKLELRRERVELAAVVEQALETSRPHLRGHEFTVSLPAQPVWLDADPVRLAQVLANLLNNACKYTPAGGQIRLSAEREAAGVKVKVRDTGMGIAADQLARVFDMFSQAGQAGAHAQEGLGIGLALARALVEMHGGAISAASDGPGAGSEFAVALPAFDEGPAPGRARRAAAAGGRARRILVVDDNEDATASLAALLRADGHVVEVAGDGERGVQAAARFRPDAVLLDIGLPGMSGLEACRAMRAQPGGGELLIAALTGWGQEEDARRTQAAGFDAHLVKPVSHDDLLSLLSLGRPPPA